MSKRAEEKKEHETIESRLADKMEKVAELREKKDEFALEKEEKEKKKGIEHKKRVKEERDYEKEYKELYDKFIRLHAEFDNFKKRITKDKQDAIRFANQELIREILPFVDNLERSLQHADETKNIEALRQGIEMTIQHLLKVLEKSGLESIKAKGEPFDPNVHEAIMQVDTDDIEPNIVVEELQRGYKLHGRVIRPATVTVSKKKDS